MLDGLHWHISNTFHWNKQLLKNYTMGTRAGTREPRVSWGTRRGSSLRPHISPQALLSVKMHLSKLLTSYNLFLWTSLCSGKRTGLGELQFHKARFHDFFSRFFSTKKKSGGIFWGMENIGNHFVFSQSVIHSFPCNAGTVFISTFAI